MTAHTASLKRKVGSLLGSVLLISGSSIGVGIMPLPILTGQAGALPTLAIFIGCCFYMTVTALLILESALINKDANFISIAKENLNKFGQLAVLLSFLFLFYSLMIAYLAKGGELVEEAAQTFIAYSLPRSTGAIFLSLLSGVLIFLGPFFVDYLNRIFMFGFFLVYLFLITSGTQYFDVHHLSHTNWDLSLFIVPFIITSFGYHNLIPSISNYLDNNRNLAIKAFIYSGVLLFFVYIIWVVGLIGIIPLHGEVSMTASFLKEEIVTQPLARLIDWSLIQYCAKYMAIFAIITSILGQGLSVIDLLAEQLSIKKTVKNRVFLCLLLFLPCTILSQAVPGIFFAALEFAGGIAAMIIFGVIPGALGWVNRFKRVDPRFSPIVPGGKMMLVAVIGIAFFVIFYELYKHI